MMAQDRGARLRPERAPDEVPQSGLSAIFYAVDRLTRERTAFMLVGSHTSTVRVGGTPAIKPGCAGCREDGAEGIAQTPSQGPSS